MMPAAPMLADLRGAARPAPSGPAPTATTPFAYILDHSAMAADAVTADDRGATPLPATVGPAAAPALPNAVPMPVSEAAGGQETLASSALAALLPVAAPILAVIAAKPLTRAALPSAAVHEARQDSAEAITGPVTELIAPAAANGQLPAMPVSAPLDQLPAALPAAIGPDGGDSLNAVQTSGVIDMEPPSALAPAPSSTAIFMSPAAVVGDPSPRLLNLGDDHHWVASLARDIAALQADDGLLTFHLLPRHLGRIDVAVQTGSDGVSVHVAAENAAAQALLAAAQTRLVDDLRQNGVRVVATDIGMAADGATPDRRDNDRPHPDQRWNFVETGHLADPVRPRTGRRGADRLA